MNYSLTLGFTAPLVLFLAWFANSFPNLASNRLAIWKLIADYYLGAKTDKRAVKSIEASGTRRYGTTRHGTRIYGTSIYEASNMEQGDTGK